MNGFYIAAIILVVLGLVLLVGVRVARNRDEADRRRRVAKDRLV